MFGENCVIWGITIDQEYSKLHNLDVADQDIFSVSFKWNEDVKTQDKLKCHTQVEL
jgi:hypothetical protein